MALTDADIERYARQIVIPGIGARGQEALCKARVAILGDSAGAAHAELYLRAAGTHVVRGIDAGVDVIIAAGVSSIDAASLAALTRCETPVCWYELTASGFRAGIHPQAALPVPERIEHDAAESLVLHHAAACDAAASACARILGLPHRNGPYELEVER